MATDLGTLLVRVGITGVRDVKVALSDVGNAAERTSRQFGMLQTALGTMGGILGAQVFGGLMRLPGMLWNAGAGAVALSNQFESVRVGLEGITGSAEEAERKMAFLKALAIPSEYTVSQLAEAGQMIEGMGMNLEKVLPLITKLTMGTRRTGEEYQRMAVGSIFGRLAQGVQPEMQAMSAFGLSRQALSQFGAQFGKNGEMLSTAREMLDALERLINTRFGRALELAANTGQAKLSALADIWEQTVARLGDALKAGVMPIVDRFASWLQFLTKSGWLDQFVARLTAALQPAGQTVLGPIDVIMATVLAMAEKLPALLRSAGEWFGKALQMATAGLINIVDRISTGTLALEIDRAFQASLPDWAFDANLGRSKQQVLTDFDVEIKRRMINAEMARRASARALGKDFSDIPTVVGLDARRDELLRQFSRFTPASGVPTSNADWFNATGGLGEMVEPAMSETARASRDTARNTRETADALRDMRATMFGGGRRTQSVVSNIEAQIALARALGYGIG